MQRFLQGLGYRRLGAGELLVPGYLMAVALSVAETARSAGGAALVALACLIAAFAYLMGPQLVLAEAATSPAHSPTGRP
jgi:hypothetical protein